MQVFASFSCSVVFSVFRIAFPGYLLRVCFGVYLGFLVDIFLPSVLGWYIPGLSELPLGHRPRLLRAGESVFWFIYSFVWGACVYPEHGTAGEPDAVRVSTGGSM